MSHGDLWEVGSSLGGGWLLCWLWEDEMPGHYHWENPEDVILASSSGNGR